MTLFRFSLTMPEHAHGCDQNNPMDFCYCCRRKRKNSGSSGSTTPEYKAIDSDDSNPLEPLLTIILLKSASPSVLGESGSAVQMNNGSPQSFDSEEERLVQRSGISIIGESHSPY